PNKKPNTHKRHPINTSEKPNRLNKKDKPKLAHPKKQHQTNQQQNQPAQHQKNIVKKLTHY
ncbi:hypothetical protein, partial [Arcanobacterium haemolyticum]